MNKDLSKDYVILINDFNNYIQSVKLTNPALSEVIASIFIILLKLMDNHDARLTAIEKYISSYEV